MTHDEILDDLAAGKISRDLDAAICVALQYVPGVPDAKKVRIDGTFGSEPMLFFQDILGTEFHPIPPLTSDLNAVVALEKAKYDDPELWFYTEKSKDHVSIEVHRLDVWLADFTAPAEAPARLGALLKLVERNTP